MSRTLIVAVIAVVVLAVGAAVALGVNSGREPPVVATVPADPAPESSPATPAESLPKMQVPERRVNPSASAPATVSKPTPEASGTAEDLEAAAKQDVASMSEEKRRAYERALAARRMQEMQERRKYELGSDRSLRRLDRDENLRLSEAQWQQINALRDSYKPKIDQAVGALYAQQAELMSQMGPMMGRGGGGNEGGNEEDRRAVFEQMRQLGQQIQEAKAPIEAEYKAALSTILTAEQTAALAQQETEENNNPGERPGRGNRGRRGDFGGQPGGGF